jgi:nucleoside-diphosphate-sugar epimerase
VRVLVIGGTGFIGPHVVRLLGEQGHDLTVFNRGRSHATLPASVRRISGERAALPAFRAELARLAPDVVLDMYAMTAADARAVVETLTGIARRAVAISSQDVYRAYGRLRDTEPGPPDPIPLDEDSPLRERLYPYRGETPRAGDDPERWADDYDKIPVERVYLSHLDLPGTILRLPAVYGPGDNQHRLYDYLKRMDDRRPAILLDERAAGWRWTRGYVEDVAAAIALAVRDERAAGRVYNAGELEAYSARDWVRHIADAAGWDGRIVAVPPDRLPAFLRFDLNSTQHLVSDSSRIRRELGYVERIPPGEALARTVAWERANPPAEPRPYDYAAEDATLAALDGVS